MFEIYQDVDRNCNAIALTWRLCVGLLEPCLLIGSEFALGAFIISLERLGRRKGKHFILRAFKPLVFFILWTPILSLPILVSDDLLFGHLWNS